MQKSQRASLFLISGFVLAAAGCGEKYADKGVAAVRQQNGDIQNCIQEASQKNPALKGQKHEVELAFEISPDGKVNRFNIPKDGVKDPDFAGCIDRHARGWSFPPPASGKMETFTYTFNAHFP